MRVVPVVRVVAVVRCVVAVVAVVAVVRRSTYYGRTHYQNMQCRFLSSTQY